MMWVFVEEGAGERVGEVFTEGDELFVSIGGKLNRDEGNCRNSIFSI